MHIKRMRRGVVALAVAAVVALTAAGCSGSGGGGSTDSSGTPTETLTIANSGELTSFDPAQAVDGLLVVYFQPVFDTLIRKKPDGSLEPMLADKWTYSEDLKTLTLNLHSGVTFTDGEKFDADAAVANLQHQKDTQGPNSGSVASISSIKASDASTVVITLTEPDPGLLDALATTVGIMASPTSLTAKDLATAPVGTGPYVLDATDTVAGDTYTYTLSKDYWNKDLQKFSKIVIKTMTDATARLNAIKAGEVQGTPLDLTQYDEAKAASGVKVQTKRDDWLGISIYDRSGTIVPALGDVRVRQAMAYAIDSESLIAAFRKDHADATDQVFNPDGEAFVKDLDGAYPYDVAKAKQLLSEAGYANGFEVTIPDLSPLFGSEIFAAVIQQLAEVGITVKLDTKGIPDLVQGSLAGKYAMAIAGGGMGSDWSVISTNYLPTSLFNPLHSEDPKLNEALAAVRTTTGDDQKTAYQDVNKFLVENAWAVPFFRDDTVYANTDDVTAELQFGNLVPYIYNYSPAS